MIYLALSALTLAVMILAAYVRALYVRLAYQRRMNKTTTQLLMNLHQRSALTEASIRDLRQIQQAESVLHALQLPGIDPMRN